MASYAESDDEKNHIKRDISRLETIAKENVKAASAAAKALEIKEKEILFLTKSQSQDLKIAEDYHHWIGISTGMIKTYLKKMTRSIREEKDSKLLLPLVESISRENSRISKVASIIDKANFNIQAKEQETNIVAYVVQYIRTMVSAWSKRIKFHIGTQDIEFTMKFKPLEVSIMLDNFISNSRKAEASNVYMQFSAKGRTLHLLVSDDGSGIPEKHEKHIFQRGFTTTIGSGIGLGHIRGILRSMGGDVTFLGNGLPKRGSGACFEVVINASD